MMGTEFVEDPPNPEAADVFQREIIAPALLVHHDGPVQSIEMPARGGAAFTESFAMGDVAFRKSLGGPDPKRKIVRLFATAGYVVSFTGNPGSGAQMPAGNAVITFDGPIYLSGTAVAATVVGVIVENWTE